MINRLYSILVSGTNDIPEDFAMWRKYTDMERVNSIVPSYRDPYRRSMWANALIELSKCSDLYPIIKEIDTQNTYITPPTCIPRSTVSDGVSILKLSDTYPVLDINADIADGTVIYSYNGGPEMMSTLGSDRRLDLDGFIIRVDKDHASAHVSNPAVSLDIPSVKTISSMMPTLKDVTSDIDITNPWDRSAVYCLYLLRMRYGR
jgi:hypothetical protein